MSLAVDVLGIDSIVEIGQSASTGSASLVGVALRRPDILENFRYFFKRILNPEFHFTPNIRSQWPLKNHSECINYIKEQ